MQIYSIWEQKQFTFDNNMAVWIYLILIETVIAWLYRFLMQMILYFKTIEAKSEYEIGFDWTLDYSEPKWWIIFILLKKYKFNF